MFRKILTVSAVAVATALGACSSGPTPYQAAAGYDRGYSEQKIENQRYRISFKGNSMTDRDTVENYLLYRAAELTLQNGYDSFTIVNRDTDKDSRTRGYGGYPRFSHMYLSPHGGWVHAWDPFWSSSSRSEQVTSYEAFAEIVMTRGAKGDDPTAFDAHQVSQNLGGQIVRPSVAQ